MMINKIRKKKPNMMSLKKMSKMISTKINKILN